MEFMDALEEKIGLVLERLEETQEQVKTLKGRIAKLEKEKEDLEAAPAPDPEREQWREERDEIRARVDSLIARLEGLLPEA